MTFDERDLAERALESRDESRAASEDSDADVWPPVSRRIAEARLRNGLTEADAAGRLDMTFASYWDLENFDAEAFCAVSLVELRALGEMLRVEPRVILLGAGTPAMVPSISFADIASRLAERVARDGWSADELGQQIGWDIAEVLADPERLWNFNVEGLYDICQALELDWVAALPSISAGPTVPGT